ncbi:hypothetical protein V6Z11_A09G087100 [Gossypium hirsutum]
MNTSVNGSLVGRISCYRNCGPSFTSVLQECFPNSIGYLQGTPKNDELILVQERVLLGVLGQGMYFEKISMGLVMQQCLRLVSNSDCLPSRIYKAKYYAGGIFGR